MKKTIVISAINLRDGGALSILNDCLNYLDSKLASSYRIVAIVHKTSIINRTENIEFIEFPKSINSYLYRFYYEYFYFKKLSSNLKPYLWLSLHDMTPNVDANIRAVYCHNPSPFYKLKIKEIFLDKKFTLFSFFYKYLYRINIYKNDYVIVQQEWLKETFETIYKIDNVIVANPEVNIQNSFNENNNTTLSPNPKIIFFYPSFPRVFKNFEIICEAVEKISSKYLHNFEVLLTIDGTENSYSKMIFQKYKHLNCIKFIGLQSREQIFNLYDKADYLIFPSKLETWGLPITEFKLYNKPILAADLPYAHETVGCYDKVVFFDHNNSNQLASYMESALNQDLKLYPHNFFYKNDLTSNSWEELFNILLTKL